MAGLAELFYDPRTGLSRVGFVTRARKLGFKPKEIADFLKEQETTQLNRDQTKPAYFPLWGRGPGSYQMDLMFDSNRTILNIINVNSRYLYSYLIKDKSLKSVLPALTDFLKVSKSRSPCNFLQSDNGSEFKNKSVSDLMKQNDVQQNFVDVKDHHGQGMVERVNQTLRRLFKLYEDAYKQSWTRGFKDLVWNYNHRVHSSIKEAPADADDESGLTQRQVQYEAAEKQFLKFKVGSLVRKRIQKSDAGFEKGRSQWSKETYTITAAHHHKLVLSDRSLVGHNDLQLITAVQKLPRTDLRVPTEVVKKRAKVVRDLRKEGLDVPKIKPREIPKIAQMKFGKKFYYGKVKQVSHDKFEVAFNNGKTETFTEDEVYSRRFPLTAADKKNYAKVLNSLK